MKYFVPNRILAINDGIVSAKDEETLLWCYQYAFDWANQMGLAGRRVFDLYLERPDPNKDPMKIDYQSFLSCKIECTEEERRHWDETQKIQIQDAVHEALKDDE